MQYIPLNSTTIVGVQHQYPQKAISLQVPRILPDSDVAEILSKRKPKKVLDLQSRDVVLQVLEMCKLECTRGELVIPLSATHARTGMYVDKQESTITRLKSRRQQGKASGEKGTCIRRYRPFKTVLDDRDLMIIKNLIHEYYIEHCKVPAIRTLLPMIVDRILTYNHNAQFMHQVLRDIGYKRIKYYSKRSVLVENPAIVAQRNEYLKTIKNLRSNIENVFYLYECVIDRSFTLHKSWIQKYGYNAALQDKNTFTFMCAGSINGFLNNSITLNKFHPDTNIYNRFPGQLSPDVFQDWLQDHLIPHLPKNSIVIMDDGPHHWVDADKSISFHSTKEDLCDYLKSKNIPCDQDMRRSELYKLIEWYKPKRKVYVVDNILGKFQIKALQLPPYMVDLNPVQYAMDNIQKKLFENEPICPFNLENVMKIMENLILTVTEEDWKVFFGKVRDLEDQYWEKDGEYEVAIDKVIMSLRDCVDTGSEASDSDSEVED